MMIHSMDLYQGIYFTAKTGSLSKAAEELSLHSQLLPMRSNSWKLS